MKQCNVAMQAGLKWWNERLQLVVDRSICQGSVISVIDIGAETDCVSQLMISLLFIASTSLLHVPSGMPTGYLLLMISP